MGNGSAMKNGFGAGLAVIDFCFHYPGVTVFSI